ncbi:hypothetical protein RHSIM_Rhsim03G0091400 [Rhododendron simsii]|uniref:Uncharacterized protein n=1 Tax=Rhododendron simsii TaxID=118357 RepID=A0A834H583_RHOSS|nr:hypothetical protein RHSIM_Rhsim03G0091400 [Rhododendron simsii]
MKIWVPTNPGGAERLAPGIIESEQISISAACGVSLMRFVEIMAPNPYLVMQNDLVHGWGLDFALRKGVDISYHLVLSLFICLSSL